MAYWYVVTGKGDVIGLADGQGKAIQSYHYDLWEVPDEPARFFPGQAVQGSTAVPQPLGYRGYVYDAESQTYWLSVRQYDPGQRRFLQPDPSEQDGVQSYVYCHDDPIDCSDPSGLGDGTGGELSADMGASLPGDVAMTQVGETAALEGAAQADEVMPEYVPGSGAYSSGEMEPYEGEVPDEGLSHEAYDEAAGQGAAAPRIRGTNEPKQTTSRAKFRKATIQAAWDNAEVGPNGGRLCPTCKTELTVLPSSGEPRDWDIDHEPPWSKREFPPDVARADARANYQEGTRLECPTCNRSAGNRRFGGIG